MKTNAKKLTVLIVAMVCLAGCSQQQVLASLEASVAATEVLVGTLQATGRIDSTIASQIESAIAGLPTAYQETAAELSSADSSATKVAKISEYYASTIASLQALPPDAQVYASAISASIRAFLSGLTPVEDARALERGGESVRLDAKRLKAIGDRAAVLGLQLAELNAAAPAAGKAAAQ
jgi:hypothetical protein